MVALPTEAWLASLKNLPRQKGPPCVCGKCDTSFTIILSSELDSLLFANEERERLQAELDEIAAEKEKTRQEQLALVEMLSNESGPNEALIALAEEYKADVLAGRITSSK